MNNPQSIYGLNPLIQKNDNKKVNFEKNSIKNGFYADPYTDQISVQDQLQGRHMGKPKDSLTSLMDGFGGDLPKHDPYGDDAQRMSTNKSLKLNAQKNLELINNIENLQAKAYNIDELYQNHNAIMPITSPKQNNFVA